MPTLPDIPLSSWLQDQQERFQKSTEGLFPALEFQLGARDAEAQIPPDYDAPGGMDQWKEAERINYEQEARRAQQQDEERRAQERQQLEDQYRQQQTADEAKQAQDSQQRESSVMDMIRGLGIPTPGDAFAAFTNPAPPDNSSTTGVFDRADATVQPPPPSEVDQFNAHADSLIQDQFPSPAPQDQQPDNTSTTGVFDRLGSAVSEGASAVASNPLYQTAVRGGLPDVVDITRKGLDDPLGHIREFADTYGAGKVEREMTRQQELEQEAYASQPDQSPGEQILRSFQPPPEEWAQANPEKARELEDLRKSEQNLIMGASGTMGGGGLAEDAIGAIKTLLSHGLDDAALASERNLAQKSALTLEEIQQRTRGLVSELAPAAEGDIPGGPLTEEERALNRAADERAASQPEHGGYLEDANFGADDAERGMDPVEAADREVPGFDAGVFAPARRAADEKITGHGALTESTLPAEGGTSRAAENVIREGVGEARAAVPRLREAERVQWASELLGEDPNVMKPLLDRAINTDPNLAGVEQELLKQNVRTVGEYFEEARYNLEHLTDEIDRMETKGMEVPGELRQQVSYWAGEGTRLYQELKTAAKGQSTMATAHAKGLQAQRGGRLGAVLVTRARRVQDVADVAGEAAEAISEAGRTGVISPDAVKKIRRLRDKLGNPNDQKAVAEGGEGIGVAPPSSGGGRGRGSSGAGGAGTPGARPGSTPPAPREETLAERLGRLKREQGRLDEGSPEADRSRVADEISETLQQIRDYAKTSVENRLRERANKVISPEEAERIVNEAVGRRTVAKITREETARQKGYWPKDLVKMGDEIDRAITKKYRDDARLVDSIDAQVQRRIDGALAVENRKVIRDEVKQMANQARIHMKEMLRHPDKLEGSATQHNEAEFDRILRQMSDHSNVGDRVANDLRERFWEQMGRKITRTEEQGYQAEQGALTEARIRGVHQQIQDVLNNPRGPDAVERLRGLYDDIAEISEKAGARASDQRKRAHEAGILRSGLHAENVDPQMILNMLKDVDPNNPTKSMKAVFETLGRPSVWAAMRELPFINMLSRPDTVGTNVSSTVLNGLSRFLIRSPLEFIGSGGHSRGQLAALEGAVGSLPKAGKLGIETYKTGINPERLDEALATGDYRHVGRENIPAVLGSLPGPLRQLGKLGTTLHLLSTRGLSSTDAVMGHVAYGAAFAEQAQRHADELIRTGDRKLRTMQAAGVNPADRVAVKNYIMTNAWDFPDVIKAAGNISDYTLFRGAGQNKIEQALRMITGTKNAQAGSFEDHAIGAIADFLMPFYNVPVNYTKQGISRSPLAIPYHAGKTVQAAVKGDRVAQGEHFAKAVEGAGILTGALIWAGADNLTGVGPRDPGDRRVWLQDHKPNSWRAPGSDVWISYAGTPYAIPLAAVANATEELKFGKKADPNLSEAGQYASMARGAGKGMVAGILSHSLVEGIIRNAEFLLGQQTGESQLAQSAADTISRYTPTGVIAPSGLMSFLATMSDTVERDTARPRNMDEVPQAIGERLQSRVPGIAGALGLANREELPVRQGAYGEPVTNERSVLGSEGASAVPFVGGLYQGRGQTPNDPITRQLQHGSIGIPDAPEELSLGEGRTAPITIQEQRDFQALYGQRYRQLLESHGAGQRELTDKGLELLRSQAREYASAMLRRQLGTEEIRRRLKRDLPVKVAP